MTPRARRRLRVEIRTLDAALRQLHALGLRPRLWTRTLRGWCVAFHDADIARVHRRLGPLDRWVLGQLLAHFGIRVPRRPDTPRARAARAA